MSSVTLPPLPLEPGEKINLKKRKLDFGPLTAIRIERGLDTWIRNYCVVSGRTYRSVIEEGITRVKKAVERQEREG